LDKVL